MRAFVTGATGFIGQPLVRELSAHGYQVSAVVRTFERAQQLPRGVRAIPADVTKPDTFRHALRDVDVVLHLASVVTVGAKPKDHARIRRINVDGARHVLALAAEAGVPKIVHVSNVIVYGDTHGQVVDESYRAAGPTFETIYQLTKYVAHYEVALPLQQSGAPVIIACPGAVYGPSDLSPLTRLLRRHAQGRLPLMIGPDNARSWTHLDDVAAGLRRIAEQGRAGETYNLTGPAHTCREFFAACARASHMPAPFVWLPSSLARTLSRLLQRVAPAQAEQLRTRSGVTYLASATKAEHELGWQARALEQGLRETFRALRSSHGAHHV